MRYRPLGPEGGAVSAVCLALGDTHEGSADDWRDLVFAALEQGINAFEIVGRDPAILDGLQQVLATVERRLLNLALRIGSVRTAGGGLRRDFSGPVLTRVCQAVTARLGCGWLDLAVLDDPSSEELTGEAVAALKALCARGEVRQLAVAGQDPAIDAYVTTGVFSVLFTPFSLTAGPVERARIRRAVEHEVAVVATQFDPVILAEAATQPRRGLFGLGRPRREALAGLGGYGFLDATPGWGRDELCLAYALSEPRLASVQLRCVCPEQLALLATVPDRELPPNVPAQIEMARFSRQAA